MAGKVIVRAPLEYMGITTLSVFIDGVKQAEQLKRGSIGEFEINKDCVVYASNCGIKTSSVNVSASEVTEIAVSIKKGVWKSTLEITVTNKTSAEKYESETEKPVYDLKGARGRRLKVYEDKCVITTVVGVGSFITGNVSDGEKTIYYSDVLSVQFKRSNLQLGYLQLETASSTMNNKSDNFFNENSFTFDSNLDNQMEEVQKYVKQKVDEAKKQKTAPVIVAGTVSNADELKKYKELLDIGVITQEEFDAKKKQLLGL